MSIIADLSNYWSTLSNMILFHSFIPFHSFHLLLFIFLHLIRLSISTLQFVSSIFNPMILLKSSNLFRFYYLPILNLDLRQQVLYNSQFSAIYRPDS